MSELRSKHSGQTVDEWLEAMRLSIYDDGLCYEEPLTGIIGFARHSFGLSGEALDAVVRRCLIGIFENGARPIRGSGIEQPVPEEYRRMGFTRDTGWVLVTHYGTRPEEMADAIIREWRASGIDPEHDGLWFAHPECYAGDLAPTSRAWPE